ncbi:MAG: hypothetical protein AUJ98_01570 [Bacteroidetes bacterium CG2_30_33_31]|nr:MAG: hypothetical protein AUJ98_01570 [Bacteroidetes bacterium CG2_30_33_31]
MISFGNNIRQPKDILNKISVKTVYQKIVNPKPQLLSLIEQLRTVATIDAKMYRALKVQLPYFIAAIFNPPYRKIENFAFAEYFIVDIDHLSEKDISPIDLLSKFKNDPRVVLAFRSPSNDGLKIMFRVKERFYDAGKYSLFYKAFAQKISLEYNLSQLVDNKTSDVSRACFYSCDSQAYYNENAQEVEISSIINFDNELEIREIEKQIKDYSDKTFVSETKDSLKQELPEQFLQKIRETLNPNIKIKREKRIYVPAELDIIIEDIKAEMLKYQIQTEKVVNINYGKQFRFATAQIWAEINLFYGQKGFTAVKTTKSGSNQSLADIAQKILCNLIYG